MKKLMYVLLAVVSIFTLAACNKNGEKENNTAVTAAFSEEEVNQNSITVKLTVDDPDDEITGTIYARLYDEDDHVISSRSFSKSTGDHALDQATVTFAALGLEETYTIQVEITVEREVVIVEKHSFTTIGVIHISTVEAFMDMDTYRGADYVLDNDLDFDGVDFTSPFSTSYFSGTFDGQGYTLSNIDIHTARTTTNDANNYNYIGVFGYASSSAEITNLGLDNITIGSEAEPQQLNNSARVGFLVGYVASLNVTLEDITVTNSHMYLTSHSDSYVIAGGIVGELKASLDGATLENSSINLMTTTSDNDNGYLVRLGGAVGFAQPDAEVHEVVTDVDLNYETDIDALEDEGVLKVAIGGVIGDNNAINTSDSITDIAATGDMDVMVNIGLDEAFESGSYALYVGGLIGYSSTRVTNGFFAGDIDVTHQSDDADAGVNKQVYVGGLFGYYGLQRVNNNLVWVVQHAITVNFGTDANIKVDGLIGDEPRTPEHVYGIYGVENVIINGTANAVTDRVIADMTDYFSSDFLNDTYEDFAAA